MNRAAHAEAARRIKELRLKHRLSQTSFAARIGVEAAAIDDWEQRGRLPACFAIEICRAFSVSLDWIYGLVA